MAPRAEPAQVPGAPREAWRSAPVVESPSPSCCLGPAALPAPAHAVPGGLDSLGATSEVPWNPPQAMPSRLAWERAVLLPGRIVSLPLLALGSGPITLPPLRAGPRLPRDWSSRQGSGRRGVAIGPANREIGPDWAARSRSGSDLLRGALESRVSLEYTATVRRYNRTLLTWSGRPLSLQYGYEWRPREQFYGIGDDAREDGVSDYASQGEFVRAGMTWESNRERDPSQPRRSSDLWGGPRSQVTRTGRESGEDLLRSPPSRGRTRDAGSTRREPGLRDPAAARPEYRIAASPPRLACAAGGGALRRAASGVRGCTARVATRASRAPKPKPAGVLRSCATPGRCDCSLHVTDLQAGSDRAGCRSPICPTLGGHTGLGATRPGASTTWTCSWRGSPTSFRSCGAARWTCTRTGAPSTPTSGTMRSLHSLHNSFGFALRVRDIARPRLVGFDFSREGRRLRFSLGGVE